MANHHEIRNGLNLRQRNGAGSVTSQQEGLSMEMGVLLQVRIRNCKTQVQG